LGAVRLDGGTGGSVDEAVAGNTVLASIPENPITRGTSAAADGDSPSSSSDSATVAPKDLPGPSLTLAEDPPPHLASAAEDPSALLATPAPAISAEAAVDVDVASCEPVTTSGLGDGPAQFASARTFLAERVVAGTTQEYGMEPITSSVSSPPLVTLALAASVGAAVDVAPREHAMSPSLNDCTNTELSDPYATPAPVSSTRAAIDAASREYDLRTCFIEDSTSGIPAPSSATAVVVAPREPVVDDDTDVSLALARMLLVTVDTPPAPTTTVDGIPPTPATSLAATAAAAFSPAAAKTTTAPSRAAVTTATLVYSRRQKQTHPATNADASLPGDAISPTRPSSPNSGQRKRFLAKITKKTARILPTPSVKRLRSRTCAPCAPPRPPRRSRRIAGMEPDTPGGGAPSRTKKKVMRALGIIGETAGFDQHSLEEYSKLFTSSARLPDSQALALSALFGWAAPDEEELSRITGC